MMKRIAGYIMILLLVVAAGTEDIAARKNKKRNEAPAADIERVKKQQQQNKREIKETNSRITKNRAATERNLRELDKLRNQAADTRDQIRRIKAQVDTLNARMTRLNDSISEATEHIESLRQSYIRSLRAMQGERHQQSRFSFIFSSGSIKEAWRRMRYLEEFNTWRKRRSGELEQLAERLRQSRQRLEAMHRQQTVNMMAMEESERKLSGQEAEATRMVASLQQQGTELQAVLREKEERARALNSELSRLIAAEQARVERERREREAREAREARQTCQTSQTSPTRPTSPAPQPLASTAAADRQLSGDFASNKGRLLFPVAGAYRVVRQYGRCPHPDMPKVYTDNSGIDLEVKRGTQARAVFNGTVASILQVPGYHNVVMIRHGDYYSVYTNLMNLAVSPNQEIRTGQSLGTVVAGASDENAESADRVQFHFELRKQRRTLNPLEWVR